MKTFRKYWLAGFLLMLPVSGIAFMGIGDSSDLFLAKMLVELSLHTESLRGLLTGVDYLNNVQNDVREGVDEVINTDAIGLPERELVTDDLLREQVEKIPIVSGLNTVSDIKSNVERVWGAIPTNTEEMKRLATRDLEAIYSLSHAAAIKDEAGTYYDIGKDLLDDLDNAHEAKATIRNAQASAVQVKQLGQIEANQGLQISMSAQQLLSDNEKQKSLQSFSDQYLDMLSNGFGTLKPMGPK